MKICMLNTFFHPYGGGIEKNIQRIAESLAKRHEVTVVTSKLDGYSSEERVNGVLVRRVPTRGYSFFRHIFNPPFVHSRRVMDAVMEERPDILHLHTRWFPQYVVPSLVARNVLKVPLVYTAHDDFPVGSGSKLTEISGVLTEKNLGKRLIRRCDGVIAVSDYVRRRIQMHLTNGVRIEVIPNGVDVNGHPSYPTGDRRVVFIGRFVPQKGIKNLLRAFVRVQEEMPDARLDLVGTGPQEKSCRKLAKGLGVNATFHGFVSEEEKNAILAESSLFVLPSLAEAFGMVILEAFSHGKPVLATDVGGVGEIVDGKTGFLVRAGDVRGLSDALTEAVSDTKRLKQMGKAAYKKSKLYHWGKISRQTEKFYRSVQAQ